MRHPICAAILWAGAACSPTQPASESLETSGASVDVTVEVGPASAASGTPAPVAASADPGAAGPVIAGLNARAGDPSRPRAERCAAVFEIFDKHIRPGMDAAAVRAVLSDRSWFTAADDMPVTTLGGLIPVELNFEDSTFVVHCVAASRADMGGRRWSDWVIYGRIGGKTVASLGPFLDARAKVTLIEYALVFPDGRIERNTTTGRTTIRGR